MTRNEKRVRFNIKGPPQKGRRTFSIVKDECCKIKDERITAINEAYKKGAKPLSECLFLLKEIQAEFYKEEEGKVPKGIWNNENIELVERYFEKEYKRRKIRKSSRISMYHKLIKAAKAVGPLSLSSASEYEIQDAVDSKYSGDKQRNVIMQLRQLLKFLGRKKECKLALDFPTDRVVKYLEQCEVDQLIEAIDDPIVKALVTIGAKCGLRQSEIYGLKKHQIKKVNNLLVDTQLLPGNIRRKPKGNKIRNTYMLNGGHEAVLEFLNYKPKDREARRFGKKRLPEAVRKACRKLWPDDESRHLNFHDLRHCYAIHLVIHGVPTETIAKYMGHSPEVCRMHYQGFMVSDTGIDLTASILENA